MSFLAPLALFGCLPLMLLAFGLLPARLDKPIDGPVTGLIVEPLEHSPLSALAKIAPAALARIQARRKQFDAEQNLEDGSERRFLVQLGAFVEDAW